MSLLGLGGGADARAGAPDCLPAAHTPCTSPPPAAAVAADGDDGEKFSTLADVAEATDAAIATATGMDCDSSIPTDTVMADEEEKEEKEEKEEEEYGASVIGLEIVVMQAPTQG